MPTITSEIFGVKHMGTIYNTIAVANPLGSYILSVRVIGYIYDREESLEWGVVLATALIVSGCLSSYWRLSVLLGLWWHWRSWSRRGRNTLGLYVGRCWPLDGRGQLRNYASTSI
ncbi:UNVERIFIED_CONTAM: hypothetical protein Sangu_0561700 [Sesamum angustifolium]|uniref:Uncharacterized protein n=1 Tax=Sesamum angustifolium TaxID=2727405 RepID=A0AAW2QA68_9LAMI